MHSLFAWLVENKEGLGVVVAVISPLSAAVTAMLAAFISYRANITGPRTQKEIAKQNFEISKEQRRFQRQQAEATLYGAYNQRWVDKFSEKAAELITSASEIQTIAGDRTSTKQMDEEVVNMLLKSNRSYQITLNETKLLANESNKPEDFFKSVSELLLIEGHDTEKIDTAQIHSITLARTIIQNRLLSVKMHLQSEVLKPSAPPPPAPPVHPAATGSPPTTAESAPQ